MLARHTLRNLPPRTLLNRLPSKTIAKAKFTPATLLKSIHSANPKMSSNTTDSISESTPISTDKACPVAGPYSQAILTPPHQRTIYISGQLPAEPSGALLSSTDPPSPISAQTTACLTNLLAILHAASPAATVKNVVKCTVLLTDMGDFAEMNKAYEGFFGAWKPARTCVAVRELPKSVPVEIEGIAVV